ncbi:MAG: ABC transporter permease [bacterium]|nr:ABC transporter permease [bacterium]
MMQDSVMPFANALSEVPFLGELLILAFAAGVGYVLWQLRSFQDSLAEFGFRIELAVQVFARVHHITKRRRWVLSQLYGSGIQNMHVVLLVGLFIGMIFALQTGIELARFGQQDQIGVIVATGMAREMGPFITAVILAATVGSALAAELGTMSVSDELSALDVMSVDAISFLVMPRVIALMVIAPLLTVVCDTVAIFGGGFVARSQLHVGWSLYFDSAIQALQTYGAVIPLPKDVYAGLFKAFIFGGIVAVISCSCGLKARGGALGVGRATSRAVRDSIIAVIIANYFLTWFIYQS